MTETLRTAAQRAELWVKEREGLAAMLGEAKVALAAAQSNAQAVDQQSRELMGLYSWARVSGSSGGATGSKVEIFQDPRSYDGSASKFKEWWTKLNAWLDCHPKQFSEKDPQGHEVPALKSCMYTVLSRLKGSKGAHYTEMELKKLADGKSTHHYWELFAMEIEGVFHPQLQQDWARNALKKLKQTDNMSTVAFIAEFMKLKYYAKTDDGAAIGYLEDNIHPRIRYQLFSTGRCSSNYDATLMAIKEIGSNLEAYRMYAQAGQEAGPSKTLNQMESAEIGPGVEEDVGALSWDEKKKGKGKGNPPSRNNKCFNCGTEGHGIKDCRKPKNQCSKCKFHGGVIEPIAPSTSPKFECLLRNRQRPTRPLWLRKIPSPLSREWTLNRCKPTSGTKRISQRSREKAKPSEYSGCSPGNGLFHLKLILSSCTTNGHGSLSS